MSQTKIPGISAHKRPLATAERSRIPAKRSHVLEDVTNTTAFPAYRRHNKPKATSMSSTEVADPNTRLMNRYYYGDPGVIEEVKKRERKIARDIQHFRKSIAEIETETKLIRERSLPDLNYEISKKRVLCGELRKDLIQLTADLDEKTNESHNVQSNWELEVQHLRLEQQIAVQETQNKLNKELGEVKAQWETKLREMENYRPSFEDLQELEGLKVEKQQHEKELRALTIKNEEACRLRNQELDEKLEHILFSKKEPLEDLKCKNDVVRREKSNVESQTEAVKLKIAQHNERGAELARQISHIHQLVNECITSSSPLKDAKIKADADYLETKSITDAIQMEALKVEAKYNAEFNKMEKEQVRRRTMENAIDELKGKIRCFAYVGDTAPNSLEVDFSQKSISLKDSEPCFFNRILPCKLISEEDLVKQECQAFFDMCLEKRLNFNIISLPTPKQSFIRDSALTYLLKSGRYQLKTQYVALSEAAVSSDLFQKGESEPDTEIQLTIKTDAIEMNSATVEMKTAEDIKADFKGLQTQVGCDKIGIVKAEVWDDNEKCCDSYYLEINDMETIQRMSNLFCTDHGTGTPISIILQTLMSKTKSLVLFNLIDDCASTTGTILNAARRISQIDAPRTYVASEKSR
ncbi:LADA_0B06304g1_1 [Lachancea dasiensis]|uniref:LADA_0B06304g1_1 n=1 Tax=Lachancea dasiensis TaxID=1072105 RepID=A0A1G4ITH5_9SACH|nr:LADA_0B06304g1_1 [Lachancea dasiensis]